MTKAKQDFEFWTGEDKDLVYTISDENGASLLVTAMTMDWVFQDDEKSGSLIKYYSASGDITLSGCTATVHLAASDTSGCNLDGTYYSELSASDSSGKVALLAWGWVNVHRRAY